MINNLTKRVLYIGINSYGSTSRMRAEKIKSLLSDWKLDIIDTDIPYNTGGRIYKSLAFRYKIGPLIKTINKYVICHLEHDSYDLIWVDKAIFLTEKTTRILRQMAKVLVHYTPDPAFTFHRSKHFYRSLPLYDFAVTTKTYELDNYITLMGDKSKVLYVTQGFDKKLHRPMIDWKEKRGVAFLGRYEKERAETIKALLNIGIDVYLGGGKWEKFVNANQYSNLHYLGNNVQGEEYVKSISACLFALGSVSKWVPEKHTTRTFEIPACGTALLTERNDEIASFYSDNQVIYYDTIDELLSKVRYYSNHMDELYAITKNGYQRVIDGGFDFESIMRKLLGIVLQKQNAQ